MRRKHVDATGGEQISHPIADPFAAPLPVARCPYVIDRRGGGYLPCVHPAGHDGRHVHGRVGQAAKAAVGKSWRRGG